jgi:indole-3-glycerol phosphate synthase
VLGLEVLVESHSLEELEIALRLDSAVIGINSRNLKTLKTDLDIACGLAGNIPADRISVAESGIRDRADIDKLATLGYKGFLIGETLMKGDDPGVALGKLLG